MNIARLLLCISLGLCLGAANSRTDTTRVIIAVIDSGIDLRHPQFAGRLLHGRDFGECTVESAACSGSHPPQDRLGHGTLVAGVIVAQTIKTSSVSILPLKVNRGMHDDFSPASLAQAIDYARLEGARVVNLSLEMPEGDQRPVQEALDRALKAGLVIVVAAGNRGEVPVFPATHSGVLVVGGIESDGSRSSGPSSSSRVDVLAPAYVTNGLGIGGRADLVARGTSFAAPHVSAAVAEVIVRCPGLTAEAVSRWLANGRTTHGIDSAERSAILRPAMVTTMREQLCFGDDDSGALGAGDRDSGGDDL